ncbi:MAG: tRNA (adenosine(37)-N6)-threonylcarbamoyltransferase complex dimerization subunit type 1 TsaB [Verrucomicrobiae bacterium]|nr:tRNA (adenosine(37)-N6)-threonylcarbamoyltransferase complex dimerization subunit type 1 TsaB [Verrucomicrobiae bacterium]
MKILALDSSTSIASIAFLDDENKILFEYHHLQQRTNSSIFFEGLERALQKYGAPDRLVVGLGPGSYNGLRSSIAAGQGIASACNIELIGLPSILGLEAGATECWVVGDARGGQYWVAALSHHQLLEEPFLLAPADLPHHLKRYPHFPLIASQELPLLLASINVTIQTPNATILARLGKDATPSASLEPLYLKPPHITMPSSL